jgi:hypothetical protein
MPDAQAVFTLMFPQHGHLINSPVHAWVSLHDPTCPAHARTDVVKTDAAEKHGFAPTCIQGMRFLRLNRSSLLCPLLARNKVGGGWKSLDFEWMLGPMAGLGLLDQKSALAVTMPIVTAFKFCIGHRKNGHLNRKPTEVKFWCF